MSRADGEDAPRPGPAPDLGDAPPRRIRLDVAPEDAGERCDRWLADRLPELSRNRLKTLILEGCVSADGETVSEPKTPVKPGSEVLVTVPPAAPAAPRAQAIPLAVVYEDSDLIVVDKPAGMAVHPAPGSPDGTLVNALLHHCAGGLSGIGGVARPGIVHRLDKETSGLIVCAKTDAAHAALSRQFSERSAGRRYLAVCWGRPEPPDGVVDAPIGRDPRQRTRMAVVTGRAGKRAVTRYEVLRRLGPGASLVACKLQTGRTHQIRVHMTHIGCPLVGDPVYGRATPARRARLSPAARAAAEGFGRQALHAAALDVTHPTTGAAMHFDSPAPPDMARLIEALAGSAAG